MTKIRTKFLKLSMNKVIIFQCSPLHQTEIYGQDLLICNSDVVVALDLLTPTGHCLAGLMFLCPHGQIIGNRSAVSSARLYWYHMTSF